MALNAVEAVYKQPLPKIDGVQPGVAKSVLAYLAHRAHGNGTSIYPAQATIASELALGERTVRRALRALEAAELIVKEREPARGKPACYRLGPWFQYSGRWRAKPGRSGQGYPAAAAGLPGRSGRQRVLNYPQQGVELTLNGQEAPNEPAAGYAPERAKAIREALASGHG